MGIVPESLSFLVELLLAEFLFTFWLKKRDQWFLRLLSSFAVLFALSLLWPASWAGLVKAVKYLLVFLGSVAGIWSIFQISPWEAIYRGAAAYAAQHIAFHAAHVSQLFMQKLTSHDFTLSIVMLAAYLIVYALIYILFARRIQKEGVYGADNRFLVRFVLIMLLMVVLLNYWCMGLIGSNPALAVILSGYSIIGCIFALFIQAGLHQQSQLEQKLAIAEHMLHSKQEQFKISEETIECINLKCHDLKHQLSMLRHQIPDPHSQAALKDIESAVLIYDSVVKTGNEALDVILTEKSLLCEKNHIQLTCMVDGKGFAGIQDTDLYSIFGNILDNAIESVMQLAELDQRAISLTVKNTGNMMVIHTENYFDHPLHWEDGLPCTTKADKRFHGFGMRSLRLLTERYGGTMSIDIDNNIFNLNIMIPTAQPQ